MEINEIIKIFRREEACWSLEFKKYREYREQLATRSLWSDRIEALIPGRTDPNVQDGDKYTPLHIAASNKYQPEIIEALLERGADANIQDAIGNTPLHAVTASDENLTNIRALLNKGAKLDIRNKNNETPLDVVAQINKGMFEWKVVSGSS